MKTRAKRGAKLFACAAFVAGCLIVGCGEESSLVGGACRYPYVECQLTCIDVSSDPMNCGGCGLACASGVPCVSGTCGGGEGGTDAPSGDALVDRGDVGTPDGDTDGSAGDGSSGDGAIDGTADSGDGSTGDGSSGDGSTDGSTGDSGDGGDGGITDGSTVDACTPPYTTNDRCGDCFTKCQGVNDTCRASAGVYTCQPFCAPPLSRCGNTCKALQTDGDNCGVCGRVCASNICVAGVCQGAASGDIVYIGHDYAATPLKTAQARLLENSVLLAPKTPVRVLVYQRYAAASSVAQVAAILADAQARTGRTIQLTATSSDAAPAAVTTTTHEVVLVHDQVAAPAGALATLGGTWATPFAAFTHIGGVVVMLDGATGRGEMPQLMTQTGLLSVTSHASVGVGQLLELISPTDSVAPGVVTPFAMRVNTSRFVTEANGGRVSWVVRHQSTTEPNVVHKIAP